MLECDVILTCTDREEYIPHALEVLRSYREIRATPILCYNGDGDVACDVRLGRKPLHLGDYQMIMAGFQRCQHSRIIKLSIDTWLLDEAVILRIFAVLDATRRPYAGNFWIENTRGLSTDVIFADLRWGNLFEHWRYDPGREIELTLEEAVIEVGRGFLGLFERHPVHEANRHECPALGMVAHHDLALNLSRKASLIQKLGRA